MHDQSTPDSEPLDAEDWEIVFAVYNDNHDLALILAQHLTTLKQFIHDNEPKEAMAAIDRAIDGLYPHTDFSEVGHNLFRAAVEGRLTLAQETIIDNLGADLES